MNSDAVPSSSCPPSSECSKETHPLSLPLFLTSSSSSLKPLRERNRTNLKRRINLSRSQVFSNDFENEDNLSSTTTKDKTATTITPNAQPLLPSTPMLHTYAELYSKTISPTTPSPIHTTVTCSQVWERLASNEEQPNSTSPQSAASVPPSAISVLPTHISFSYEPSDDEEGEELPPDINHGFQYVPVSSQSKLVQFQFLTFARQQRLASDSDDDINNREPKDSDDDDDDDEDEDEENSFLADDIHEYRQEEEQQQQENRTTNKRKRSVSVADSIDARPSTSTEAAASSTTTKPPCSKKPKIKDPNANYQRLNMRKKNFSHAKKHQFAKHKRNAFYRRMRNAGGK